MTRLEEALRWWKDPNHRTPVSSRHSEALERCGYSLIYHEEDDYYELRLPPQPEDTKT